MSYKIAIATTDGKVVNQHFGRASVFYIVNADSEGRKYTYLESRQVTPVCQGKEHDEGKLREAAGLLKDCNYVLVSQIGEGARYALEQEKIKVFEIPGFIEDSIKKLLSYVEVSKLLE
ncbi:NifB/NifX family molybdenum-iron cluster-binding protein [Konateibacter massiliensis]|uniref:NifB/NifX family molybdenum-iron cluster-binding protein n=1 Tax=Konateibacter massiliensis TaxID=2002841 RepID=UPI000C145E52|nr:NifB/NifX family molybdenum-iron cluster-binding protein [Konateibacter massiliensis]